ncbi:UbiA family prenyltransferase [Nocardia concava]|uniref:UbiA family prenyltransferase n=1 Tax=Nocardia concava TaxID=257281 RepID=UPI0002E3B399|nr:UbiA family prenyltransferase [Nocardia concava]
MTDNSSASLTLSKQWTRILTDEREQPVAGKLGFGEWLGYGLRIRRVEFLPLTLTVPLVPALLIAGTARELLSLNMLLATVVVILSIQVGNMANCLADREMDAIYKTRLSQAVYGLGVTAVVRQIAASSLVVAVIEGYLTYRTGHLDLLLIGGLWAVLGMGYSLPPLHLNGRGIWQLPVLLAVYFILPGLFVLRAFEHPVSWAAVGVICGFALTNIGVIVINHAEDFPEDELYGIRTYVRALGLTRALTVGVGMLCAGASLVTASVLTLSGPNWGLVLYLPACLLAVRFVGTTALAVRGRSLEDGVAALRARSKLAPPHTILVGWTTVLLAALVFAAG